MKEGHVPVHVGIKKGPNLEEESFRPGDMIIPDTDGSAAARTHNNNTNKHNNGTLFYERNRLAKEWRESRSLEKRDRSGPRGTSFQQTRTQNFNRDVNPNLSQWLRTTGGDPARVEEGG